MKEKERLEVVRRIEEDKSMIDALKKKSDELAEMLEDEKVKRYLALNEEIAELKDELSLFDNDIDAMIHYEFQWALVNRLDGKAFSPCEHDIWIYEGSYYYYEYASGEHDKYYSCEDENSKDFHHNKYVCLECNKKVEVTGYEEFELTHFVLKNRKGCYDIRYFRELYFKLLYTHSAEEAKRLLILEFERGISRKLGTK